MISQRAVVLAIERDGADRGRVRLEHATTVALHQAAWCLLAVAAERSVAERSAVDSRALPDLTS